MGVSWGAALRPKRGQSISGDAYVVAPFTPHGLQVAVIDGLGGGEEAARAAQGAVAVISGSPAQDPAEAPAAPSSPCSPSTSPPAA
jgi:negative regulator of sigma-B (phosphoserine phosphatase)